jgi:hypothetical protein
MAELPNCGRADCELPAAVLVLVLGRLEWGNKWGNVPHRLQPIPADLDPGETA